jgi:hypothetical protein
MSSSTTINEIIDKKVEQVVDKDKKITSNSVVLYVAGSNLVATDLGTLSY